MLKETSTQTKSPSAVNNNQPALISGQFDVGLKQTEDDRLIQDLYWRAVTELQDSDVITNINPSSWRRLAVSCCHKPAGGRSVGVFGAVSVWNGPVTPCHCWDGTNTEQAVWAQSCGAFKFFYWSYSVKMNVVVLTNGRPACVGLFVLVLHTEHNTEAVCKLLNRGYDIQYVRFLFSICVCRANPPLSHNTSVTRVTMVTSTWQGDRQSPVQFRLDSVTTLSSQPGAEPDLHPNTAENRTAASSDQSSEVINHFLLVLRLKDLNKPAILYILYKS